MSNPTPDPEVPVSYYRSEVARFRRLIVDLYAIANDGALFHEEKLDQIRAACETEGGSL